MYRKLIPFLLLLCLSVLCACTKNENHTAPPQAALMDEAKLFFESQVVTGKDMEDSPKTETLEKSPIAKEADWKNAFTQNLAFGATVVVPLKIDNIYVSNDRGKTKQLLQDNAWLIIYKVDKKLKAEVLYKYPASNNRSRKFTGDIEIQHWDGTIIKTFRYVNGVGKKAITHIVNGRVPQTEGVNCETTEINQCVYFRDQLQDWRVLRTNLRCFWQDGGTGAGDGGEGYPETGGGGNGGSSSGSAVPGSYEVTAILNNLTSPCLIGGVNYVREGALRNQVSQILKNMFDKSDILNARFFEEPLADSIDGDTKATPVTYNGVTTWNMDITLNSKLVTKFKSSKEYVVATILHEVIHAYFRAIKVNPLVDHNEMGLFYIDKMAEGIKEVFPRISADDAKALAWGGVHESYSWMQLVRASPTAAQKILDINKNYRTSVSGTKCN